MQVALIPEYQACNQKQHSPYSGVCIRVTFPAYHSKVSSRTALLQSIRWDGPEPSLFYARCHRHASIMQYSTFVAGIAEATRVAA